MNKKAELLFLDQERNSKEWVDKFFELGENGDTEGMTTLLNNAKQLYLEEYDIYDTIQHLTNKATDGTKREKLIEQLRSYSIIKKVEEAGDTIMVRTPQCDIIFVKLTGLLPGLKEESLETWDRMGRCHTKSIEVSSRLEVFSNDVVTGYIYDISDKAKFLHSWLEFSKDKKEYVIDYTMNVVMNKEGYYYLRHADPITRINDVDIREDKKKGFSDIKGLTDREYLVFRHEIAKELRQKEERDGKLVREVDALEDFDFCISKLKIKYENVAEQTYTPDYTEDSVGYDGP